MHFSYSCLASSEGDAVESAVLEALEDGSSPCVSCSARMCPIAAEGERSSKALLASSTGTGCSTGPDMAGDDGDEAFGLLAHSVWPGRVHSPATGTDDEGECCADDPVTGTVPFSCSGDEPSLVDVWPSDGVGWRIDEEWILGDAGAAGAAAAPPSGGCCCCWT